VAEVGGGVGVVEREEARERAGEGELEGGVPEGFVERERREGAAGGEVGHGGAVGGPEARGGGGGEEVEAGELERALAVVGQAHRAAELVLQHGEVGGEVGRQVGVRARRGRRRGCGERRGEQRAREEREQGIGRHGRGRRGGGSGGPADRDLGRQVVEGSGSGGVGLGFWGRSSAAMRCGAVLAEATGRRGRDIRSRREWSGRRRWAARWLAGNWPRSTSVLGERSGQARGSVLVGWATAAGAPHRAVPLGNHEPRASRPHCEPRKFLVQISLIFLPPL